MRMPFICWDIMHLFFSTLCGLNISLFHVVYQSIATLYVASTLSNLLVCWVTFDLHLRRTNINLKRKKDLSNLDTKSQAAYKLHGNEEVAGDLHVVRSSQASHEGWAWFTDRRIFTQFLLQFKDNFASTDRAIMCHFNALGFNEQSSSFIYFYLFFLANIQGLEVSF